MNTILLVDDNEIDRKIAAEVLQGSELLLASSLDMARELLKKKTPQLILLDLHLGDGNGLEFCAELRNHDSWRKIPVIFLTSSPEVKNKVLGFALGAEDYIVKPFEPQEFKARVSSKLHSKKIENETFDISNLHLDLSTHKAYRIQDSARIDLGLTPHEFRILSFLVKHPDHVMSREQIIDRIWGNETHVTDRNVDSQISKLRKKLKECQVDIHAVYGSGYQFSVRKS